MPMYSERDILAADKAWRINFINSLVGFKNLNLLITRAPAGVYNAAIFNSGLHIGSSPPYVGFLLRPTKVPRHTYENLLSYPYATMNVVTESLYKRAHLTHHHIPAAESELAYAGLEVEWVDGVPLPVLRESPVRALLRFSEEHLLQVNQTRLLIFSIVWVEVRGDVQADGFVALDELNVVAGSGCDAYYRAVAIGREVVQRERA